ncbi:Nn.00g033270.m01.CDS01 [Neocucurbitaria sp. VM-36]
MGGIAVTAAEAPVTAAPTATSIAAASTNVSDDDIWVGIEQGGKLVMKKSYYKMPPVSRDDEPKRPLRPKFLKVLGPSLYNDLARLHDWVEWAGQYIDELEKKVVDGEITRAQDQKVAANVMAELQKKYELKLSNSHIGFNELTTQAWEKNAREAFEQRKEDLKAAEVKAKRLQAESKTYQDLCDVVQSMSEKTGKAVREMRTLTAAKNRPQQAFDRWEKLYCEPNIGLVKLNQQVKKDRDENRRQYVEQMRSLQGRVDRVSKLTIQKLVEVALIEEQRQALVKEKEDWHIQKSQELSDSEQKCSIEAWIQQKIEEIKPEIMKEATEHAWMLQKHQWELQTVAVVEDAKEQGLTLGHTKGYKEGYAAGKADGRKVGYENGYKKGKTDVSANLQIQVDEARSEAYGDGSDEGYAAGMSEGYRRGLAERIEQDHEFWRQQGYSEGQVEGFARGKAEAYEKGRNAGYSQGHEKGYAEGQIEGYEQGYQEDHEDGSEGRREGDFLEGTRQGLLEGVEEGVRQGHEKGRLEGHKQGWYEGHKQGWYEGHKQGWYEGHKQGWHEGQKQGSDDGHKKGFFDGYEAGKSVWCGQRWV